MEAFETGNPAQGWLPLASYTGVAASTATDRGDESMQVKVTGRHFDASNELQAGIEAQVAALAKYNDRITGAHVVLDKQPNDVRSATAELTIAGHGVVAATAEAESLGKAVDELFEKLTRLLKKENEKNKDHRAPPVDQVVDA